VTTREELYLRAGRGLELCQLLETEIGTALLALDALVTRSHLKPDPDQYLRLRDAIEKQTLGRSLKQMKEKLKLQEDLEEILANALKARNDLAHKFYARHGLKIIDDAGRTEMLSYLNVLIRTLEQGYGLAGNVAAALVHAVTVETKNTV
jgi:hypothetical protein